MRGLPGNYAISRRHTSIYVHKLVWLNREIIVTTHNDVDTVESVQSQFSKSLGMGVRVAVMDKKLTKYLLTFS